VHRSHAGKTAGDSHQLGEGEVAFTQASKRTAGERDDRRRQAIAAAPVENAADSCPKVPTDSVRRVAGGLSVAIGACDRQRAGDFEQLSQYRIVRAAKADRGGVAPKVEKDSAVARNHHGERSGPITSCEPGGRRWCLCQIIKLGGVRDEHGQRGLLGAAF
jgi:hypothetical protein